MYLDNDLLCNNFQLKALKKHYCFPNFLNQIACMLVSVTALQKCFNIFIVAYTTVL